MRWPLSWRCTYLREKDRADKVEAFLSREREHSARLFEALEEQRKAALRSRWKPQDGTWLRDVKEDRRRAWVRAVLASELDAKVEISADGYLLTDIDATIPFDDAGDLLARPVNLSIWKLRLQNARKEHNSYT